MRTNWFRSAALSVLALGMASSGQAQLADDDEIIVTGQYLSLDKMNAVKTPTPVINVPQSLSIIPSAQIEDQAFTNIGDILRYTPGLAASQGEGHRDAIIIRGNQSTADFFLDGVRDDVQYFRPLYNLEQVEILRGSNALLFGRGGGGGVINRVTKRAELSDNFTELTASIDTFGAHNIAGDTNFTLGADSALRINGFYEGLDNHRNGVDGTRFGINPTARFEIAPETTLDLSYEYLDDDRVVDRGVPSVPVTAGPDVPLEGFDKTFFGADDNQTTLQAHILRARADHAMTDNLRANLTVQYADYDKLYQNIYPAGLQPLSTLGTQDQCVAEFCVKLDGYRDTTDRANLIIQGNLVGEFETGRFTHTVLVGAEYGDQATANARIDNRFVTNNDDQIWTSLAANIDVPDFSFSAPARNRVSDVTFFSAYAQDQIDIGDTLKLVLGARFDSFDIDVLDIQNGNSRFTRKDEEITPRFGLIYKPQDNISIYGSYSETFLPRSGEQFLTLNLDGESTRPQFFKNSEIGAKWDIRPGLSLTSSVFKLDRESFTSVDPNDAAQLLVIEGSQTKGFEFQLTGDLTDQWYITTGYSYLDGQVDRVDGSGHNGNKTRQTPEHMASIWNNYQYNDRLAFGLGATYQDSYFVREDNAVEVPGYIRFDAAVYYDLSDATRLQINMENLADTNYFPDAHSNDNISVGRPRNARFTVKTRF